MIRTCTIMALVLGCLSSHPAVADSLWNQGEEVTERLSTYSVGATRAWAIEPKAARLADRPASIELNIPGRSSQMAYKERVLERGPGDLTWIGRIESDDSPVMLTIKHGWMAGVIHVGDSVFEITPEAEHGSLLMELDAGAFPACDGGLEPAQSDRVGSTPSVDRPGYRDLHAGQPASQPDAGDIDDPDGVTMDLLVVYTPAVRQFLGGTDQAQAFAQSAVDTGTTAFGNSEVNAEFVMVHAAEMSAQETSSCGGSTGDLPTFRQDPAVHQLRDEHHADMVGLIVQTSYCGCGYVMRDPGPQFEDWAYQVTARQCAVGNLTYAHEHGHNMGMEHDPANGTTPGEASYPWSFAHFVDQQFRTVMSYFNQCTNNNCPRQPHFSNPDVTIGGQPTGIDDARDNARTATLTAPIVSEFRQPPADLATVEGNVEGLGHCDINPEILAGASVEIIGQSDTLTTQTNTSGQYELELPVDEGPVEIQVSAEGHVPDSTGDVELAEGEVATADFELRLAAPCPGASPATITLSATENIAAREDLVLENTGAGSFDWYVTTSTTADCDNPGEVDWLFPDPASGLVAADDTAPAWAMISSAALEPGEYQAYLCYETDEAGIEPIAVPVELQLLPADVFEDRFETL